MIMETSLALLLHISRSGLRRVWSSYVINIDELLLKDLKLKNNTYFNLFLNNLNNAVFIIFFYISNAAFFVEVSIRLKK